MSKDNEDHKHIPTVLAGLPFACISHKPDDSEMWIHLCVCAECREPFTIESAGPTVINAVEINAEKEPSP